MVNGKAKSFEREFPLESTYDERAVVANSPDSRFPLESV